MLVQLTHSCANYLAVSTRLFKEWTVMERDIHGVSSFAEHPFAFGGGLKWIETHEFAASNHTYRTAQIPAAMALFVFRSAGFAAPTSA